MFSTITTAPSTTMPKSSAPSDSRFAGMPFQVQANGGEQQRKRDGEATMIAARTFPEKQKQNDHHQDDAFRQVVQHGFGGEVHQIAAVDERNDLHAGRQNVIVQFLHFLVNSLQRRVRLGAFAQQHDAGNHIVVIDDLSVLVPDRPGELAQADLRALRTTAISFTCGAACRSWSDHGVFDVVTFLTRPTSRMLICCRPASTKLPPALALLLVSCCSTWPMLSP
jgi:reverse gyrase